MNLIRHELNYEKTLEYIESSLKNANGLSNEVLKTLDFEEGTFFTLLHEKCNLEALYNFKDYFILPCGISLRQIIRDSFSNLIFQILKREHRFHCVFDDIIRTYDEDYESDDLDKVKYLNNEQIYLVLNDKNSSPEVIIDCFYYSYAFWHSLCLLTTANLEMAEGQLSNKAIHEIAAHSQFIMIGAYDGDGYVFWERNGFRLMDKDVDL